MNEWWNDKNRQWKFYPRQMGKTKNTDHIGFLREAMEKEDSERRRAKLDIKFQAFLRKCGV